MYCTAGHAAYFVCRGGNNNHGRHVHRKLVDMIFSGEKRLALKHLCENATCAPDIDLNIVLLPRKHDFRSAVVSCGNVASHLRVLDTGKTEIAYFQVAILVHKDIARLQVAVNNTSRMNIFESAL